jgi:hypothetical protein
VDADLDPDGIAIVRDLARRTALPVTPLLMRSAFLHDPAAVTATPAQVALASRLAAEDHAGLADLDRAIVATQRVRE